MKRHLLHHQSLRDRRGATLVMVALMLTMFIAFAALAIDVGYAMVVRNEVQNVADAAALAGARQLGAIYEPMTMAQQESYVCDPATITSPVLDVASQNKAAQQSMSIRPEDVKIGKWHVKTATSEAYLEETLVQPDAVQVVAHRDGVANGPVSTFFAKAIGIDTVDVSAVATAALTGVTTMGPGELIPVGISKEWFDATPQYCGQPIKFSPSNAQAGCAGWNTYTGQPANDAKLRNDILNPWLNGTFTAPGAQLGTGFEFIGGNLSNNTFLDFTNLFDYMKTRDGDGDPTTWSAYVTVYSNDGCANPNQNMPSVGFAAAKITSIVPAPDKIINAVVICNLVEAGRGGGRDFGVKGAIPGLVQ